MPVPNVYNTQGEQKIATYTYTDTVTGIGYLTAYGTDFAAAVSSYALHVSPIKSQIGYTTAGVNVAQTVKFDLLVKKQLKTQGRHIVYIPIGLCSTSGTQTVSTTVTASIRKVSNAVESHIASAAIVLSQAGVLGSEGQFKWATFYIDCTPQNFRPGDSVRLVVDTTAPGANQQIIIFHDPMNMDPDDLLTFQGSNLGPIGPANVAMDSRLRIDIPLKIAL